LGSLKQSDRRECEALSVLRRTVEQRPSYSPPAGWLAKAAAGCTQSKGFAADWLRSPSFLSRHYEVRMPEAREASLAKVVSGFSRNSAVLSVRERFAESRLE
jgi:hypothetical protein